jgi:Salmonella virulence plasmid 65kDa B protein
LGFSLSTLSIKRKTEKGIPQYRDVEESDVFLLSNPDDLVPVFKRSASDAVIFNEATGHPSSRQ